MAKKISSYRSPNNTGRLFTPLQSAMIVQSERLQLERLVTRVTEMNTKEITELAHTNPSLVSDWVEEMSDRLAQIEREQATYKNAIRRLQTLNIPCHLAA